MKVVNFEKIYEDSFGLWVSGLFGAISGNNPGISFEEHKEVFFWILEQWIQSGKILFCDPQDPLGKPWKADAKEIILYLKERWPESAKAEDDENLNLYFYEIPAILWVGEDGKLHGS